jgi:hypothetical protein
MPEPHRLSAEKMLKDLETSPQQGLSTSEATRLLTIHSPPHELIESRFQPNRRDWLASPVDKCQRTGPAAGLRAGSGISGMACKLDPVGPEVVESVRLCRQAGIRPIMI